MRTISVAVVCAAAAVLAATLGVAPAAAAAARPTPRPSPKAPAPPPGVSQPSPTMVPQVVPTWQPQSVPSPRATALSLAQAQQIAMASSPQLALARAVVDQNNAGVGIARAGELPDLSANATYSRSKSTIRTGSTSSAGTLTTLFTQNQGFLQLRQLILDGGRINAEVQSARYSTNAAKLTLLRQVQTVLLTVAQQYFTALQARHQLQAAQRSLEVAKVQERLVEAQFHAGVASKADVLTAQLPVAEAEVTLASAQNGEAQNVASLLTTMGLPATTPVSLKDDTAVSGLQPKLDEAIDEALHERTDLSAAKESVNSAQAGVRAAKLAAFPLVDASANSGTASTTPSGGAFASNWSIGASLSFPLYSGGLIRSQADEARAIEQQAQANLKTTELTVYENVQQAYLQLATAASSLNAAKVALDQAQVVLDVTNAQYKAGVTTLPLLLNAQSQLTTAQSNYVQSLYAYKIAQQNLLYAEGVIGPAAG